MADQQPGADRRIGEGRGIIDAMEADAACNVRAAAGQIEDAFTAEAKADGGRARCIDLGQPFTPSCVPGPRTDSNWKLSIDSLTLPATNQGRAWDVTSTDEPDPFVCFTFTSQAGQQQVCTDERHGKTVSWRSPFTAIMPWSLLQNVSVSVFDGDAIGDFAQCEGQCPALANWPKELAYGMAWDLRPQWDGEDQVFVLRDAAGLELKLRLTESFAQP
jgi:hypothetical protein